MAALAYLAPDFIKEGRLCWLRSPLYIVNSGKKETYYFTDEEFAKVRGSAKGEVQRNKGLGSLSADQARRSMFDSAFQHMDQLIEDTSSFDTLSKLMGPDSKFKHDFIWNNIDFSTIKE